MAAQPGGSEDTAPPWHKDATFASPDRKGVGPPLVTSKTSVKPRNTD
jgi:hypothetical protein